MSYELTVKPTPAYLHVIVTGQNTKENVMRYMEEVMRECNVRQCKIVLIEERLVGPRLNTVEVFSMVSQGAKRFLGHLRALAYVDTNADGPLMQFAETVAINRGIPVQVFSSVAQAEQWLSHLIDSGT